VPLNDFHRISIRFIIVTCIVCFYVFVPQAMNVILAWSNITELVQYIATANYSLMALYKLIGTWYHGESKLFLLKNINEDSLVKITIV